MISAPAKSSGSSAPIARARALADRLGELAARAERIARNLSSGAHGRRRSGAGENFWQYRAYGIEDDAHRIDWRQSARSDELWVREREHQAAQSVYLWCDLSASMRFGAPETKLERGLTIGLALAFAALAAGERVAWLDRGARARAGALGRTLLLERAGAALGAEDPPSLPPEIELQRSAKIVAVSDFLVEPEELGAALRRWTVAGAQAAALHVIDPAEARFPFTGRLRLVGLEGEGERLIGDCAAMRATYLEAFEAHAARLDDEARRRGWPLTRHRTDQPPAPAAAALHAAISGAARGKRR